MCSEAIPWSNQSMPSIQSTSVSQCSAKVFSESKTRFFSSVCIKYMLNCKINGTVHIFFLKRSYLSLRCPKLPNFFSSAYLPLYLHVIIDLGHIWGPFMAKFDKMSKKSAILLVPDFGYPPVVGAFVSKCWT